jgi:hypothetical protein
MQLLHCIVFVAPVNNKIYSRTPWTGDQPVAMPIPTQDNTNRINADIHALVFEPTIPVFERAKTFRDLTERSQRMVKLR